MGLPDDFVLVANIQTSHSVMDDQQYALAHGHDQLATTEIVGGQQ
jgi:hypothetical protein